MNKNMGEIQVQDPSGNIDKVPEVAPAKLKLTRALRRTDPNSEPFVGEGRRQIEPDEDEETTVKT